jgi:hypothetical protein
MRYSSQRPRDLVKPEIVQTAQIENSSAEMIRYYLSLIPEAFKFVWAHVNVAENTPQSSNFERTVAMHWN